MSSLKKFLILFFVISTTSELIAQNAKPLFQSDSIIKLTIKLNVKELINDLEVRDYHPAILSHDLPDGTKTIHDIKVKVRGNNRAKKETCSFPPLELNFKKKSSKNSVFKGQNKLKLVTHCKKTKSFDDYIYKEYTVYKMYQLISPLSFNVRLCEVTYINDDKKGDTFTYMGFLIERTKDIAKRNDLTVFKDSIRNQETLNKTNLDRLNFFQYMIGNLDWSIPYRHNIKIVIDKKGGLPYGIPYDFDHSGFVNAPYAYPPPDFNISSVRARVFRGFCRYNNGYDKTIEFYQDLKPEFYSLINNSTFLTSKNQKYIIKYLDSYYDILDNPKDVNKKIVTVCRVKHKHAYEK